MNLRNTSTTCPRCRSKLEYVHRLAVCIACGFKGDRDAVGAMNIWLKTLYAHAGESGSPLSVSAMKDETRQSRKTKHEGMRQVIRNTQR